MEVGVFSRRGADPAAAFPHHLTEKHDVSDTEFLTDAGGYLTALARFDLYGELNYSEQNFHREVVQDRDDANRPLSLALAGGGESSQRTTLATTVQESLQLRSAGSSARWTNTR